jgi:formate--tetrahydrofolate ligase
VRKFGVPVVVGVNRFSADTPAEAEMLRSLCAKLETECITSDHWAKGSAGAVDLAHAVVKTMDTKRAQFQPLYPVEMPLWKKAQTIAREIYGADDIIADQKIRDRFRELQDQGYGHFPVCIAKTQYSFSTDPDLKGAPKHHVVPIREVRLSAGAEFVVAICGDIMTMPGLPKVPAANKIDVTPDGKIVGLF